MKAAPFVPAIEEITPGKAGEIPGLAETVAFWTRGRPASEWFCEMEDCWGTAGFVLRRGEEAHGFILYGPPERFPRAQQYPVGPLTEDAAMLAYAAGDARTRRRLLVRMLRDLRHRGVGKVEAVASNRDKPNHLPTDFMLESGWKPVRQAPPGLGPYTLVHIELSSAVEVGELARSIVGKVRLPTLKNKVPAPGVLARSGFASADSTAPSGPLSSLRSAPRGSAFSTYRA